MWVRVDWDALPHHEVTHTICEGCYEKYTGHPIEYEFYDPRRECLGG